jgi:Cu/Zn superoxide dismutase
MHFHEKVSCDDPTFKAAGSHVHAKTPVVHGILNADANDAGDLPNLFVGVDGAVMVMAPRWSSMPIPMTTGRSRSATPAVASHALSSGKIVVTLESLQ